MYSMKFFCTSSSTEKSEPLTVLTTAAATSLKVCARPVPQLKMPDTSRFCSSQRFTLTASSTCTKSRCCPPSS